MGKVSSLSPDFLHLLYYIRGSTLLSSSCAREWEERLQPNRAPHQLIIWVKDMPQVLES